MITLFHSSLSQGQISEEKEALESDFKGEKGEIMPTSALGPVSPYESLLDCCVPMSFGWPQGPPSLSLISPSLHLDGIGHGSWNLAPVQCHRWGVQSSTGGQNWSLATPLLVCDLVQVTLFSQSKVILLLFQCFGSLCELNHLIYAKKMEEALAFIKVNTCASYDHYN